MCFIIFKILVYHPVIQSYLQDINWVSLHTGFRPVIAGRDTPNHEPFQVEDVLQAAATKWCFLSIFSNNYVKVLVEMWLVIFRLP